MGLSGSVIEQWLMASERILYPMNPSEVVVHLGFNDIYNEKSANYNASASDIAAQLIQLFDMYHENMPNATVYFCSIESSKWHKNPGQNLYERSFGVAVNINKIIEEYAEKNSWLEYVNTRVIFCDNENKIIYDDGDGNTDDDDTTGRYCGGSHPSLSSYDKYYELINEARRKHWLEES